MWIFARINYTTHLNSRLVTKLPKKQQFIYIYIYIAQAFAGTAKNPPRVLLSIPLHTDKS